MCSKSLHTKELVKEVSTAYSSQVKPSKSCSL